jgi:hypothetical protein
MESSSRKKIITISAVAATAVLLGVAFFAVIGAGESEAPEPVLELPTKPKLDRVDYDRRMIALANRPDTGTAVEEGVETEYLWPAEAAYPNHGAILPFKRVVAYYGNFYSKYMGILGEYGEDEVIRRLMEEVAAWEEADPNTPVMPAIDYIAVTAQASAGEDGRYRLRMPDSQIDKALAMAEKIDGIVFLEVQPGLADLMGEIKALEEYLIMPQVHLAIDPEFNMKLGGRPGERVGTVDATDVNEAIEYLSGLVRDNELPPKILIVHRYTRPMVTNATDIEPTREVQVVMDMDGWGPPWQKRGSYNSYIVPYPVQFTGFKVFYKNDTRNYGVPPMTPPEILELAPKPIFIQYQ